MNQIIINAELRARLSNLDRPMELCDESGRTLGYFHPVVVSSDSERRAIQSPFTREEIEQRSAERTGRSLAEILDDLSRR
jgi:hypothetical protein